MVYLGLVDFFGRIFEVFQVVGSDTFIYRIPNKKKAFLIDLEV